MYTLFQQESMVSDSLSYRTNGDIVVSRLATEIPMNTAIDNVLNCLNTQRGGLLSSSYEYPGRYKRWAIGFINPPLELSTQENNFKITTHNDRGVVLLPYLLHRLSEHPHCQVLKSEKYCISGTVKTTDAIFSEEERSKKPSVFSVIREIMNAFHSPEDNHLGVYGAFGYDLVFQYENIEKSLDRPSDQQDLVLFIPDELFVVDYYLQRAFCYQYDFETSYGSSKDIPRTSPSTHIKGRNSSNENLNNAIKNLDVNHELIQISDHKSGEYAAQVHNTQEFFRQGDLFEVVLSQNFSEACNATPVELFQTLQKINPSPYGFIFNLGDEHIIGASPEMFVRSEGKQIETCPISGTIPRGQDAIEDAVQIRQLLNSHKDEVELTMCTDVDRNDKSRICEPGSVRVVGRRQIELYSHLIHTVDHVEGLLRDEFDALDAFLSHVWAVTVTGAPKRAAIQFIEQHEHTPRRWYGGAIGYLAFNGNLNTGLSLRMIRLKNEIAEVRVGATLLNDSIPELEEQETLTKAAAMFQALKQAGPLTHVKSQVSSVPCVNGSQAKIKNILLIDYEDSFVHTLADYIRQMSGKVTTLRHGFSESLFDNLLIDLVVLSPGPGRPSDFRISETVAACIKRQIPIFGVCLGLQGIVEAFGGELGILNKPQHGKSSRIFVTDRSSLLFKGLPESFEVGRYHSLYAQPNCLPPELKVTAMSQDQVIMGIEHKTMPIVAVQFHPESIMTLGEKSGLKIISNVVNFLAH